jgi:haloacetate dehalogenase
MTHETDIERRALLRTITAASGAALTSAILPRSAAAQPVAQSNQFEPIEVKVGGNTIFVRRYGKGSPVLMVHGFPRTSLMWRYVAPQLANDHTVICVDLRGYGRSGSPTSAEDHFPYSKRAMASELVAVMENLGFPKFDLVGHDRGGRVSYRLTLPEKYLLGAPDAVFDNPFGGGTFEETIKAEYLETYRDPERVHAICEEYRAAAGIDIEHDKKDVADGKKISCPMLHLWAKGGPLDTFYEKDGGALGIWRKWANNVQGQSLSGGHFFPEENPNETAKILTGFLAA